jgi:hydrogenase maturation protease
MAQRVATPPAVLVLGLGNVLWADDGFGVRAVETLQRRYCYPDHVTLMDGGIQGFCLLQHVQSADILVVFDAIDCGLPPGTLKLIEGDAVPKFLGTRKTSLHQAGFDEVLALAGMLGDVPGRQLLVGVQPVALDDFGGGLRPAVQRQIEPAIGMALDYLEGLGVTPLRRVAAD